MNNASQTENLGFTNFETRRTLRKPWSSLKNVKKGQKKLGNKQNLPRKKTQLKTGKNNKKEQLKLEHKPTNVGKMALE